MAKDDSTAVKWSHKAAEQGIANAQCNLGIMYAAGRGVSQDFSEALRWLRKAEAQGDTGAADIIQFVQQELRKQQMQAAGAAEPSSPPPIPIGTNVQLRGLQAKPELNGQRGVVTGFEASTGRCSVQLEDGRGTTYSLKPENLDVEEEGATEKKTEKTAEAKTEKKTKKKKKKKKKKNCK